LFSHRLKNGQRAEGCKAESRQAAAVGVSHAHGEYHKGEEYPPSECDWSRLDLPGESLEPFAPAP
jgi:hypothetical protein